MSMDLLKAISEPKMTAQDLARQEEQARVKQHGGIFKPTQDQNILEGMRKVTGWDPKSLEQTPLDRAMLAGQWATDVVNPGAALGGKAMMPAFKEAMGVGVMPLVTRFRRLFKGGPVEETERLHDVKLPDRRVYGDPNKEARFTGPPEGEIQTPHDLGGHYAEESNIAQTFLPEEGKQGLMSQVEIIRGRSVRAPAPVNPPGTFNAGEYVSDYEQVGRFVANSIFDDDKVLFKRWMKLHPRKQMDRITQQESGVFSADAMRSDAKIDDFVVDEVWERLSPNSSYPKKLRGGHVTDEGKLISREAGRDQLKEMDNLIKMTKKETPTQYGRIDELIQQRAKLKEELKRSYVKDFGGYLFKSGLSGTRGHYLVGNFDNRSTGRPMTKFNEMLVKRFRSNMKKKNISEIRYINTSPFETGGTRRGFGSDRMEIPPAKNKISSMVIDIGAIKPSWGRVQRKRK